MHMRSVHFRFRRATLALALLPLVCLAQTTTDQQADPKPEQQVTGSGGHLLRFSSTQVMIEQTPKEQQAFDQARDCSYPATDVDKVLTAAAAELTKQGYGHVEVDREFHLIEARHDETLVRHVREILRGVAKARGLPLPARPDHQSTEVLLVAMPQRGSHTVTLRTRFRLTIWDSAGDSKTSTLSDPTVYHDFYAGVGTRLGG
jgi:hypothetical protein